VKAPIKLFALPAVLAATAIGVAGCGGGGGGDAQETATPSTTAPAAEMSNMETTKASGVSVESPAADLRVTLDRLLGEHAILAMLATQKGFDGEEDFEPIAAALDRNSAELADACLAQLRRGNLRAQQRL
jgi:hypothetical protein